jgi:hypothetical protein
MLAVGGGWFGVKLAGLTGLFVALGLALAAVGIVTSVAVGSGVWFVRRPPSVAGVPQPS